MLSKIKKQFFFIFPLVLIVVGADQLAKIFFSNFLSCGQTIPVIKNIFHFTLVYNTGIAFGLFRNSGVLFIVVSAIVIGFIFLYLFSKKSDDISSSELFSFGLILSGAIGNLIDRIFLGHVIDFIDFRIWPVFNIADSAITIGTIILLIKCVQSSTK